MDHEYELEDDYAPRVLWGRLAFFAVALLVAFVLGRCTKGDGVSQADYNAANAQVVELTSENAVLQAQLDAAAPEPGGGGGDDGGGDGADEGAAGEATEAATEGEDATDEDGQKYTVQSGDTLTIIAERFYGDPRKFDLIVDANNLTSATSLRVGQELVIPPNE